MSGEPARLPSLGSPQPSQCLPGPEALLMGKSAVQQTTHEKAWVRELRQPLTLVSAHNHEFAQHIALSHIDFCSV